MDGVVTSSTAVETQPLLGKPQGAKTTDWMKALRGGGTAVCIVMMVVSCKFSSLHWVESHLV